VRSPSGTARGQKVRPPRAFDRRQGAAAVIWQTRRGAANNPSGWLTALLERKAPKLAAVALANKMARIAWKPMASATQAPAGLSQPPDEIGARGHCLNALAPTLQETERDGRDRSIGNGG
jgi:hypothetical protein